MQDGLTAEESCIPLVANGTLRGYTREMLDRTRTIKRAAVLSLTGNAALALVKIAAGILGSSLAVLGDGIDSSVDVLISIISLAAAAVIAKPSDREHPYGHARAETTATTLLSFAIFFAGAQLVLSSIADVRSGAVRDMPAPIAFWAAVVSIAGKLLLAWSQFALGRKAGSAMLLANGKNMRNDVVMSCAVLAGIALSRARSEEQTS